MQTCCFCNRTNFKNRQSVRAHLKHCPAYDGGRGKVAPRRPRAAPTAVRRQKWLCTECKVVLEGSPDVCPSCSGRTWKEVA